MLRNIGALVAGLVALVIGLVIADLATRSLFPVAIEINANDPQQLKGMFAALPTTTKLLLLFCWFVGPLAGALTARWIETSSWPLWTVVILAALCVGIMVAVLPMPAWMQAGWVAGPLLAGLIAHHFGPRRAAPVAGEYDGA